METESRLVTAGSWGGCGKWGVTANAYRVSFKSDESVLELDRDDGCTMTILKTTESCTFEGQIL